MAVALWPVMSVLPADLSLLLPLLVLAPLLATAGAVAVPRHGYAIGTAASVAGALGATLLVQAVTGGGGVLFAWDWAPSLGITFALRADGLSALFALLVTGIGALVFPYAGRYLALGMARDRSAPILLLFQASMLGAVLADDFLLLFVFWEVTSVASFLLIGFDHERAAARRAAVQGLLVTVAGGLALLAGIVLLVGVSGTSRIGATLGIGADVAGSGAVIAAMVLIAIGAFAKSAQAPLHFWLPNAMAAPTPVSAYLHSATMVKLGVYLLARLDPLWGIEPLWIGMLVVAGTTTMAGAAILALRERDLKRMLAHSTVVALGTLTMLVGLPTEAAAQCFALVLVVHALYKAALFFVAGIIDHETGTRDATRLGGLARAMPATAVAALLAAASMAGMPPFLGFLGKEALYDAQLAVDFGGLLVIASVLVNGAMLAVAGLVALRPFFGPPAADALPTAHDPGAAMLVPPLLAGLAGCAIGLMPWVLEPVVTAVALSLAPHAGTAELRLWHGWTPELALSCATLLAGVAAYRSWPRLQPLLADLDQIDRHGAERGYEAAMAGMLEIAKRQTAWLQVGDLRRYLARTVAVVSAAIVAVLVLRGGIALPAPEATPAPIAIAALLVAVAIAAMRAADHALVAFMAAGAAGFGAAALFLVGGAPDLAFTQVAVEALAIVLFLAVLGRLPLRTPDPRDSRTRWRDGIAATAFGAAVTLVLMAVQAATPDGAVADWYRANSLPAAMGSNVVNVIIVDFRALDTLGEISVLAFAALGALALVRGARQARS
jgi:multicomponent Na+:H+ antiporter subunit A